MSLVTNWLGRAAWAMALAAMTLLAACTGGEKKDVCHLSGTVKNLPDGTRLLLTDIDGRTIETLTVKDGKFSYDVKADSIGLYSVYVAEDEMNGVSFFNEPGSVRMTMAATLDEGTVAGTPANDGMQELNNATRDCQQKIREIENLVGSDTTLTPDAEWALAERYMQLYSEFSKMNIEAAEKNIDNELGYLLVTRFIDEVENADLVKRLISLMPPHFRQRTEIVNLEKRLE